MTQNCDEILNNKSVTEIFKSNNTAMHSKLRSCITNTYRHQFYKSVPLYNSSVSSDLLLKTAGDIFTESIDKLQTYLLAGTLSFEQGNFNGWLYTTFKNAYLNKFNSEITRQKYHQQVAELSQGNAIKDVSNKDVFSHKTYLLLNKIGQPCKDYLVWHYIEDMSIKEISTVTGKSADGIRHQLYRCRNYFKDLWHSGNATNKTND